MSEHGPLRSVGVLSVLDASYSVRDEHLRDRRCRKPSCRCCVCESVRGVGMPVCADGATRAVVRAACQEVPSAASTGVAGAVCGRPQGAALAGDARMPGGGVCSAGRWRGRLLQHPLPTLAGGAGRRLRGRCPAVAGTRIGCGRARAGEPACVARAGGRRGAVRCATARRGRGEDHQHAAAGGLRWAAAATGRLDHRRPGRDHPQQVRARAAQRNDPARPAGAGRPRQRASQGQLGSGGVRSPRQPVVHRDQPALAGPVRQTVGGRTVAPSPRPRRRPCPREDQRAGPAVGIPRPQAGSRPHPIGVGPQRHRGLPQQAGLPGVHRRDQPVPAQLHLP